MSEFRDKLMTIGVISRQSSSRVREGRDGEGNRVKEITDEAGNITRYRNRGGTETWGVELRPKTITFPEG